jgi:predicted small secreted protein
MKTRIQRIIFPLLAGMFLVLYGTGCKHTAEGVGDDIEEIGDEIEEKTD